MALNACLVIIRNIIRAAERLKGLCVLWLDWIDRRLWDYKMEPGRHARKRSSRKTCEYQMRSALVDSLKGRGVECVEVLDSRVPTCSVPCELGFVGLFYISLLLPLPFFSKSHLDLSTVICGVSRIGRWPLVTVHTVRLELPAFSLRPGSTAHYLHVCECHLRSVFPLMQGEWECGCEGSSASPHYIQVFRDWEHCLPIHICVPPSLYSQATLTVH